MLCPQQTNNCLYPAAKRDRTLAPQKDRSDSGAPNQGTRSRVIFGDTGKTDGYLVKRSCITPSMCCWKVND